MRKTAVLVISLLVMFPVCAGAECRLCDSMNAVGVDKVDRLDVSENDDYVSGDINVQMLDGNEFIVNITFSKKDLSASLVFASGTTVVVTPSQLEILDGEGSQEFDDVTNSIDFFETYASTECIVMILLCLFFPLPLSLIACYLAIVEYC